MAPGLLPRWVWRRATRDCTLVPERHKQPFITQKKGRTVGSDLRWLRPGGLEQLCVQAVQLGFGPETDLNGAVPDGAPHNTDLRSKSEAQTVFGCAGVNVGSASASATGAETAAR